MRILILLLLLSSTAMAQLAPPTQSVKRRHGQATLVVWDLVVPPTVALKYFSLKYTPDLNTQPVEFKQVPKTERQTQFVVTFTPQYPKYAYYVVSAIYEDTTGESFPSNTIMVERVGPPPN